jgi:hypothetical protein
MKRKYYILIIRGGEVFPLTGSRQSRNLLLFDNVKIAKRHALDHWKPGEQDAIAVRLDAVLG